MSTPAHRPRERSATTPCPMRASRRSRSTRPTSVARVWNSPVASMLTTSLPTAQASGLPPKVEPCWPGLSTPRMSRLPTTAETGLDLVGGEEDVLAGADLADVAQVAVGRDDHAALALDRLDEDRHGVRGDRSLEGREVAVRDHVEAGGERAEPVAGIGIVGEADDGRGAAVEVAAGHDDPRLVGGHALDLVAPLAADLDGGLDGLGAGVHGEHQLLATEVTERGAEISELVVDERAAGQRQAVELRVRGRDEARVAVAEVERGVAREQVEEALAVDVGHP